MFEKKEKKNKYVIDIETAEQEFVDFCEDWEIDDDITSMNEEDEAGFNKQKRHMIIAIRRGRLVYNREDETLKYVFSEKTPHLEGQDITLKRAKGKSYFNMDGFKEKDLMKKTFSVIGDMAGKPVKYFANVDLIDTRPFTAIVSLFLAG